MYLHCFATITTICLQNFFIFPHLKLLYPLNTNSPFSSPPPDCGNSHFALCLYEFFYFRILHKRIHKILVFCDWLISLSIMFSSFIHVVACVKPNPCKTEFLCQVHDEPLFLKLYSLSCPTCSPRAWGVSKKRGDWSWAGSWRAFLGTKAFPCPQFLVCRKKT